MEAATRALSLVPSLAIPTKTVIVCALAPGLGRMPMAFQLTGAGKRELVGPQRERITHLSTLQLVKEIATNTSLLVKKQVELTRTELRADVRTEAKVAGGLTLAAVCVATLAAIAGYREATAPVAAER